MKDTKLIRLLKTFSKDEWKEFEKFADSPYFNKGRNYTRLVKYFKGKILNEKFVNPEPEKIYAKLYPGKSFNKNVINTILSGFTKLAEEFLIQSDYDSSGQAKRIGLLRQLEKRNCDELLIKEVASAVREYETKPFDLFKLDFLKSVQDYVVRSVYKSNYDKKIENPVIRRADYTFFIFYLNMLNEERDLRVMKNILNKTHPGRLSAVTVKNIESNYILSYIDENYPELSGTLGLLIRCFVSRDFYGIKTSFFENCHLLEPTIARNISYVIEGLLFDLLAEGKKEYLRERFLLLKFLAEKDLLVDRRGGLIPTQPLDNVIHYSFWNKEFDWLESFIEKYKQSFPPELKSDLIRYANSHVLCGRKKYSDSLREIKLIGNVPFMIKRRVKELELQLLFELNDFEAVQYAIDNYAKFIRNETVSPIAERMMKSNLMAIKPFLNAYNDNNIVEYSVIQKKLMKEIPTQFGDWLLEKIDELTNKKGR
jgi:hypothetical protein